MKSKVTVRYASGREEQFEVELFGTHGADTRLQEFLKDPTIVLELGKELLIIPAQAIECVSVALPDQPVNLPGVRKARRLK